MISIRSRLTFWYVGLLAVVLVALGTFVVLRLRADLTADVDRAVSSGGAQIARGYAREGVEEFLDLSATVLGPGASASQVLDPNGRVLLSYGRRVGRSPALPLSSLRRVSRRSELHESRDLGIRPEPYRVYAQAVTRQGQRRVVVVLESLAQVNRSVHRLLVLLLIGTAAALLLIAIGGWWLARKALAPVAKITDQANRIGIDQLKERIPLPRVSDEVGRLAATLNAMLDRLDRGVQEQERLVADASHELRTPLAVMRSELDVALLEDELPAGAREVLASAREEVDRMTAIVENLLTLARVDEGGLELLRRDTDLGDIAADVACALGAMAESREVRVTLDAAPVAVVGDRERLRQVVSNLVDNAIKYSPAGGEVHVRVWRDDGNAALEVRDAGPGIPEWARPSIFDRFYRVDASRARAGGAGGGSGLGLAIAREIVQAHGGSIWVECPPSGGTSFRFTVPAGGGRASDRAIAEAGGPGRLAGRHA
jgi:heavy metal sensor kinase